MSKCKFKKICKGYQKDSALCDEDAGSWSYDKKCNEYIKHSQKKRKGLFILLLSFLLIGFVSATDTTQIYYDLSANYQPWCASNCSIFLTWDNNTNTSSSVNLCSEKCYADFNISIQFLGDDTPKTPLNVNTSQDKTTKNWIIRGNYLATLGNSSDITGINEKLLNITSIIDRDLVGCLYNNTAIQNNATLSVQICNVEKDSLSNTLSQKNTELIEAQKYKGQRAWWGIVGVIAGILLIKFILPFLQNKLPKKDPHETGQSPYEGHQ